MTQPANQSAGVRFEQTTTHHHRMSPCSYGFAHSQPACTLHSFDATPVRPPSLGELVAGAGEKASKGSQWLGGSFDKKPPKFFPQPELSKAFTHWQAYIKHHIDALSHSPPQFSVRLTPTLHHIDEKCDVDGTCIAIILPLRVMGIEELQCMTYGMLPGHDMVICVEVGRQLSSSPTSISFQHTVQVFTLAGTLADTSKSLKLVCNVVPPHQPLISSVLLVSAGMQSGAQCMEDPSSFPLACLIRQNVASLLEGYPPFFPGPQHPPHPLNSFPSCIQSLVTSYMAATTGTRRSLLSLVGGALPENPIAHVMRFVQSALREASRACVVCGELLPDPIVGGYGWCHRRLCEEAFLSSPYTARVVHPFVQSRSHQLDLLLHVLSAATSIDRVGVMPEAVSWTTQKTNDWNRGHFRNRREVFQATQSVPSLDELLLYDEDELTKQLNEVHLALLPLLAWTINTYRTFLFPLPPVSMGTSPACNIHHMAVSVRPAMSVSETNAYVTDFHQLVRHRKTGIWDGGSSTHSFLSAGLWLLHIVLAHHGVISAALFTELEQTSYQLRAPYASHRNFSDAAETALALLSDHSGRRQPPATRWNNSVHPSCACVLMVELKTDHQVQDELPPTDKYHAASTALVQQPAQQTWWIVRAVYTFAAAQSAELRRTRRTQSAIGSSTSTSMSANDMRQRTRIDRTMAGVTHSAAIGMNQTGSASRCGRGGETGDTLRTTSRTRPTQTKSATSSTASRTSRKTRRTKRRKRSRSWRRSCSGTWVWWGSRERWNHSLGHC